MSQINFLNNRPLVGIDPKISSFSSKSNENNKNTNDIYSRRLLIDSIYCDWSHLLPNYCPLKYSKPVFEFQHKTQKYVQDISIKVFY